MTNFFKHAPVQDTDQKRFLEAVRQRRHVIASLPLGYPAPSLYALPAMVGSGLAVAVCRNRSQIRRNLEYFKGAGYAFPEVASLDGSQAPHEERAIQRDINHNRVRLLYTTPERFSSLTFLEILVHAEVTFLLIEEAERLLPAMPGYALYKHFYEEGLCQLAKLPPMVLLVPPLAPARFKELSDRLKLHPFQVIQSPPLIEPIELRVERLLTEHQKFETLVGALSGNPGRGKLGRLDGPGAVLIQTAFPAQAEKLGASLLDYGFESVWINHFKRSAKEQAQAVEVANTRLNAIVVNAGLDMRHWSPPPESKPRLVFWSPPAGVEDLLMQTFRQTSGMLAGYGDQHLLKGLVLYTKEDFQAALKRLQPSRLLEAAEIHEKVLALRHYRRWVLADGCRVQSLAACYQGSTTIDIPPCGRCDHCRPDSSRKRMALGGLLKRWLY